MLVAGLSAGYFASRYVKEVHARLLSDIPLSNYMNEFPSASVAGLSSLYDENKEHFQEVVSQGSVMVRETAFRKQELEQSKDSLNTAIEIHEHLIRQLERDLAILRLKDYYTKFYMHYFRWLDSGNEQSAVKYKLALGQFKATLNYSMDKQREDPLLTYLQYENLSSAMGIAEQSDRTIRWARVIVVVLIFLLVMGIPRFIRNIGYKRFAASLYFNAVFRPSVISVLNSWHSKQRMVAALLAIYLFAMVIFSSFVSWRVPLVFGGLGLFPLIFYTVMSFSSRRLPEVLISFLAPKILILILLLGIVALRGPNFLWYRIWEAELFRTLFISLLFMLIFHKLRVNMILVRKWSHRSRRGSLSIVVLALGLQLLLAGTLLYISGPREGLLALNRDLLLLPDKLIGSPSRLLFRAMLLAGAISVVALFFFILNRKREDESTRS